MAMDSVLKPMQKVAKMLRVIGQNSLSKRHTALKL